MELQEAIQDANTKAPYCVGWDQEDAIWVTYNPSSPPLGIQPQLYCAGAGTVPVPLRDIAAQALASLVNTKH
jgi:hypothetical protein